MTSPPFQAHKIRCVLFDLGGTLWQRSHGPDWRLLQAAVHTRAGDLLRRGEPARFSSRTARSLGRQLHKRVAERRRSLIVQSPEVEPDGAAAVSQVLDEWGVSDPGLTWSSAIFAALDLPIQLSRHLFPDSADGLAELRARGLELGVVTNRFWGGPAFVEAMRALGLLLYFDAGKMAVSADLGVRKPGAAIFQHALDAHRVAAEETLMVGNTLLADVHGAQRAGMAAAWKPRPRILRLARAHLDRNRLSIQQYNEGRRPMRPARDRGSTITRLRDLRDPPESWRPFVEHTVSPDLIVESMRDLVELVSARP